MDSARFSQYSTAVLLVANSLLCSQHALAQEGTSASPIVDVDDAQVLSSASGDLPDEQQDRMPLADDSVFEQGEVMPSNTESQGTPGVSESSDPAGSGDPQGNAPASYGGADVPYTTARVAVSRLGLSDQAALTPVSSYPYRPTGKLWSRWGGSWYVCTASLIKKGVLVTAAHCIHRFGERQDGWPDEVRWHPANYRSSGGPYGAFTARQMLVPTPYYNGTDTCTQAGVVCNNDIATVVLNQNANGRYAGQILGWYGYGWNGFSYRASPLLGNRVVHITQLGYPSAFDEGYQMQRTDAVGWYTTSGDLKNTQIGSAQTGGSSGGPWLVNFGARPTLDTTKAKLGQGIAMAVVGVTSYGAVTIGFNQQGASYFGQNKEFPGTDYSGRGAGNIGKLMADTCASQPAYC